MEYVDTRLNPKPGTFRRIMQSPWFWPISALAYVGIGYVLVGGFAAALGVAAGLPAVVGMGSLLGLLLLAATAHLLGGIRRNRARTALGYLEQAARLNLPLPAMLHAAESAETGGGRAAIQLLRARLEDGVPVASAFGQALSGASPRQVSLIGAGERVGRLGQALRRLTDQDRCKPRRDPANTIYLQVYPLVLSLAVSTICALLILFVIPKYKRILHDFHAPVPAALDWLGDWSGTVIPLCGAIASLLLLSYVGRMTAAIFSPRLRRPAVLEWIVDRTLWGLPLARGIVRGRGMADVCNVAADALDAGYSPALALADASELKVNAILRRRVRHWAALVEAGQPLADAARAARMPKLLVGMLSTASGEDVPRVLQFLARYYESRFSRSAELLRGAAIPTMAMGFGAVVLFMAYTLLVPLISLADAMCSKLNQGGM